MRMPSKAIHRTFSAHCLQGWGGAATAQPAHAVRAHGPPSPVDVAEDFTKAHEK